MRHQPFFIPSAIFAVLAIPLILGLVPPNPIYGFRTRHTLSSREVWYAVNRKAGWLVLVASLVYMAVAWALPYYESPTADFRRWIVQLVAFIVPLGVAFWSVRKAGRGAT